ncbi:hypothetical protein OKW21_005397 [Catalinimonas alkaloidigena]|uniref:DUF4136 domain-containing protein n=1 Tax=Catalinimonas alkaloidigena TaxID=1075417 RepID=UPI0024071E8E|nr:DUF4136 domain-containing protein [Catalinimonas alkaloidigena]MDF9800134.1 hypothetical protein [Catalinimonas alkaloidigena]
MKYLSILLTCVFVSSVAFAQQNDEVISKQNEGAELDGKEAYNFGNNFMNLEDEQWYTFSTLHTSMVQNAIVHEFDTYGYDYDTENPELLINYMIFDQKYNEKYGYYKDPYTVDQNVGQENILAQLEDGSLVVSVVDPNNGKALWVGYVPDAVEPGDSLRKQQIDIRNSVANILESFIAASNFDDTAASY